MERVFKSKIDAWPFILLAVFSIAIPVVILAGAYGGLADIEVRAWITTCLPFALTLGLPLWLFFTTSYTILPDELVVRCGLLTRHVPLRAITAISRTRTLAASPALSFDRLGLAYGIGEEVVISPKDRIGFLNELLQSGVPAAAAVR